MVDLPTPKTVAPWLGMPVGLNDRNGQPIHFGDVLYFDAREWGAPDCFFCIDYYDGDVHGYGTQNDWPQWCDIVRKWDGTEVTHA